MKWRKIWQKPEREATPTPRETPKKEARKEALRIEELEPRIAPNAIWGD